VDFSLGKSCQHLSFYCKVFVFLVELYPLILLSNRGNLPTTHHPIFVSSSYFWKTSRESLVVLGSGLLCYSLAFYSK
jgi:hypothetical protein